MKIVLRFSCVLLAVGCQCGKKPSPENAFGPVATPPDVIATVAMRSPEGTAVSLAALATRLGLPADQITPDALRELLASELSLAPQALSQVDLKKPLFAVLIDGRRAASPGQQGVVFAVPMIDETKFVEGLRQTRNEKVESDHRRYDPKAGGPPIVMTTGRGYALLSGDPAWLQTTRAFVLGTLVPAGGDRDVEVRVFWDHWFNEPGEWEQKTGALAQKLGAGGPLGRMLDALRDTREIAFHGAVSQDGLVLSAELFPKDSGRLHDVIERQHVAEPWGVERLAASSWLLMGDHYDPKALAEWAADSKWWLDKLAALPEVARAAAATQMETLAGTLEGSLVISLSQAEPPAGGFVASAVARVSDAAKAKTAVDALGQQIATALGVTTSAEGKDVRGVSFSGLVAQLAMPTGARTPPDLSLGWGVKGDVMALAVGQGAVAETSALLGGPRSPSMAEDKAYGVTLGKREGRVGMLYVSPGRIAKMLTSMAPIAPSANAVAAEETRGALLQWGVAPNKAALTMQLDLPADAFLAVKPIVEILLSLGMMPQGSLKPAAP